MLIGINATAAFKQPRTGVEEYVYQLIKHLTMLEESKRHRFILYNNKQVDFNLPENFEIKQLQWPLPMWTQIRLAAEMSVNKPDILFIPVHILPLIHPKNSVVTLHGLEYEYYPKMYPRRHLGYIRWSTKYALKNARKIIAISENTKKDLVELYGANSEKIKVVHHGFCAGSPTPKKIRNRSPNYQPYILFIGRLETKKNIQGLIKAFNLLKEKYQVPHQLVLAGSRGYDYESLRSQLKSKDIIEKGYVSQEEKRQLLQGADIFAFISFYEGFGIPILEAQAVGCPVITSDISSMPEIAGDGAVLIEPKNIEQITEAMYKIINNNQLKKDLITKGYQNIKKFSWQKCAQETLRVLTDS